MQQSSTAWSTGQPVTAAHLNEFRTDLATLFKEISSEDFTTTYNSLGQLTQIIDNENTITINLNWSDFNAVTKKLYIQKSGDPKKYTITYNGTGGSISSILYAV